MPWSNGRPRYPPNGWREFQTTSLGAQRREVACAATRVAEAAAAAVAVPLVMAMAMAEMEAAGARAEVGEVEGHAVVMARVVEAGWATVAVRAGAADAQVCHMAHEAGGKVVETGVTMVVTKAAVRMAVAAAAAATTAATMAAAEAKEMMVAALAAKATAATSVVAAATATTAATTAAAMAAAAAALVAEAPTTLAAEMVALEVAATVPVEVAIREEREEVAAHPMCPPWKPSPMLPICRDPERGRHPRDRHTRLPGGIGQP